METEYMLFTYRVGSKKIWKSKWSHGYLRCKFNQPLPYCTTSHTFILML